MARYLSLDWDHQQLLVVSANVGRGSVQIQKAVSWTETLDPNGGDPEALGKLLRERLDSAGIAPAPVLVSIGRDRMILKEVKFPNVPAAEEPALVRFQAAKELTDAPEDMVIDYARLNGTEGGERKAVAVIIRRQLLASYEAICKAAGLKLAALSPRTIGILEAVRVMAGSTGLNPVPLPPDATVAALVVADRWAGFSISRTTIAASGLRSPSGARGLSSSGRIFKTVIPSLSVNWSYGSSS